MKYLLAILLLLAASAHAQLGKGRAQNAAKYGNARDVPLITKFIKDRLRVEAILPSNTVSAITYQMIEDRPGWKPRQMKRQELEGFLSDNKDAGAWEKTGPRTWRHVVEKKSAFYSDDEHRLYVWENVGNIKSSWERRREIWEEMTTLDKDVLADYQRIQDVVCKDQ